MSNAGWDPVRYLTFADERTRPGLDLMVRIPDVSPKTVVDLGCGTGHLTARLRERWPDAEVLGLDSSAEMVERARQDHAGIEWKVETIETWQPIGPVDLIYSNATLHWLGNHEPLFGRLADTIASGGALAVQMPDNWAEPTHRIPAEVLDEGSFPDSARNALLRDRVASPAEYRSWLHSLDIEMWRTTYFHQLVGEDPVWTWVTGSVLRPVLATLEPADRERFEWDVKARYRDEYPSVDGVTILPFSRLFIVGTRP